MVAGVVAGVVGISNFVWFDRLWGLLLLVLLLRGVFLSWWLGSEEGLQCAPSRIYAPTSQADLQIHIPQRTKHVSNLAEWGLPGCGKVKGKGS